MVRLAVLLVLAAASPLGAQPPAPAPEPDPPEETSETAEEPEEAPALEVLVIVESADARVRAEAIREALGERHVEVFGLDDPRARNPAATVTLAVAEDGRSARVIFVPRRGASEIRVLRAGPRADVR
ncbi:MAG: hypothetical protein AAGH15_24370, partial [Myxococcota bacterium]